MSKIKLLKAALLFLAILFSSCININSGGELVQRRGPEQKRWRLDPNVFGTFLALDELTIQQSRELSLNINGEAKKIIVDFAFLDPDSERKFQMEDLINNHGKENRNILKKAQELTGLDFGQPNEIWVGIGRLYSSIYYVSNSGMNSIQYPFGMDVHDQDAIEEMFRKLVDLQNRLNAPLLFFDAISYAKPTSGALGTEYVFTNMRDSNTSFGNQEKADIMANRLIGEMETHGLEGAIYHIGSKNEKVLNKWTNAIVQNYSQFERGRLGFIADIGKTYSVKVADQRKVNDKDNLIVTMLGAGEDKYQFDDAIRLFTHQPDPNKSNPIMDEVFDKITLSAKRWLIENSKDKNLQIAKKIERQNIFYIIVRATGELSALYYNQLKKAEASANY